MMKLLVVDDSELIRTRLVSRLRGMAGLADVATAENLAQTLDHVYENPPSLLLMNLHLPDGNAMQALQMLKRMAPDMLIVILSNDANGFNRDRCRQAGAAAFFDKSIEFEVALDWIARRISQISNSSLKKDISP